VPSGRKITEWGHGVQKGMGKEKKGSGTGKGESPMVKQISLTNKHSKGFVGGWAGVLKEKKETVLCSVHC